MSGSALFVDLYELTMAQSYVLQGMNAPATFSVWVRSLPPHWGYLVAAGIPETLQYLVDFRFTQQEIEQLRATGRFRPEFLRFLTKLRFTGEVRAVAEGCPIFANEPLLEIQAPIAQAQLLETLVINALQLPTLAASKASRCVAAARGRAVVDFSMRRTHGRDAAHRVCRSTYLAGMAGTSNVECGLQEEIPLVGTMAHSYVMSFADELAAFRAYADSFPENCVLLVDTYDTLAGVAKAIEVAHEMRSRGQELRGVRLDSGDLGMLSRQTRALLDAQGLPEVQIFVSGGLDEYQIDALLEAGAAVDAFGVGTFIGVPRDAPTLDIIYKMVTYDGRPVAKKSPGKATLPGAKQVWRRLQDGTAYGDDLGLIDEEHPGRALLQTCVSQGQRRDAPVSLATARQQHRRLLLEIPAGSRRLRSPEAYGVRMTPALQKLSRRTQPGTDA